MSLLLETIKLQDGEYQNLFYHEQRMNRSLKTLCGEFDHFDLEEFLKHLERPAQGLFKCRIVYDEQSKEVEFMPYTPKPVNSLRVIEHDRISYEFKYADRKTLNKLYELRQASDDILIVKRGLVTDSSYANIVFRRGKHWYTPWSALLKGTQRAKLLERDVIHEEEIRVEDIETFETFKLINAMLEFESPEIDVSNIVF
ncbi:4-amino-4-deoxychorismate lyase [Chryseolinea serpens]|jgi:4-amino-4-deoxychorismate lyase|uniref:4-amino-4-deoxychorismate lyase n=1 Tax=Chryseolinea serpens TaxID=947013 RepID=A0A1M5X112_9BACT|nr:aminotransferase class IV [Chryseolinea serpens]SHH93605.1 4-amino-4-deoxychorismate lyase [Chryseolinea serpens]